MILHSLRLKPMHGYALAKHIKAVSDNLLQIEEGSLYPALQRMLKAGWLKSEAGVSAKGRPTRIYRLTACGHSASRARSVQLREDACRYHACACSCGGIRGRMRWFGQFFSRRRRYDDLTVSIKEHLEEKIDELMEGGMPREEAERTARREFGNLMLIEERSREVWQWPTHREHLGRYEVCFAAAEEGPGIHGDCGLDTLLRHCRQRNDVQPRECVPVTSPAGKKSAKSSGHLVGQSRSERLCRYESRFRAEFSRLAQRPPRLRADGCRG